MSMQQHGCRFAPTHKRAARMHWRILFSLARRVCASVSLWLDLVYTRDIFTNFVRTYKQHNLQRPVCLLFPCPAHERHFPYNEMLFSCGTSFLEPRVYNS